jgi:predicted PurR-regulated permease PerM
MDAPRGTPVRLPPWRWIWRLAWLVVAVLALASVGIWFLYRIRELLLLGFLALFASFALEPAVGYLAARGWRRGVATFAVMGVVFLLGVLLLALMIPVFIEQLLALVRAAPDIVETVSGFTRRWLGFSLSADEIAEALRSADADLGSIAQDVAGNILGVGAAVLGTLFRGLTLALFAFYLVAEGPRVRRLVCSVLPPDHQRTVLDTWEIAIDKTGAYLYSRLVLAVLSGTATFIVLRVLDVQSALPLAVWMGIVSQFIPVIGTYIAMALPLLVAVVADPIDALIVLIFFVAYQQLENVVLAPKISARTLQLHPAIAFAAAIAGASLSGVVGALIALPIAAIVQAVGSTYVARHEVITSDLVDEIVDEMADEGASEDRPA